MFPASCQRSVTLVVAAASALALAVAGCGSSGQHPAQPPVAATPVAATSSATSTASAAEDRLASAPAESAISYSTVSLAGHQLQVPSGWRPELWAHLPDARLETWTPEGALLVSQPDDGQITELTPIAGHPSATPRQTTLVSGLSEPQGMAFDDLDGHEVLYVAEDDEIDRYAWLGDRVGARRVIVANLPDTAPAGSDNHELKNVVVGPGQRIYVDIGSGSNAGPAVASDPPRAAVVSYDADGGDLKILATGVRNGDGLSFAPDGTLWTAVNGRDQIAYPYDRAYSGTSDARGAVLQPYVNNHPVDQVAALSPGTNLGWPYCEADPDVRPGAENTRYSYTDLPFIDDEQTNPTGAKLDCAKLPRLQVGLPAHSAPLGLHFLENSGLPAPWSNGAVVAAHGSWDAEPPRQPGIFWMPWDARTHTLGTPVYLITGFQEPNGQRWGRPVDAVAGPGRSLYVSDDLAGAIYCFTPPASLSKRFSF